MEAASFSHFPLYHPDQVAAGLAPWLVPQAYFLAKNPRDTNRAVDISGEPIERKIRALWEHTNQMVLTVAEAQAQIASAPYDVPAITSLDPHDYREFIANRVRTGAAAVGKKYGLEYAEHFRRARWGGTERMAEDEVPEDEWQVVTGAPPPAYTRRHWGCSMTTILDPTDERVPVRRSLTPRPEAITGVVGLLNISKPRGEVLIAQLETRLRERLPNVEFRHYAKPTFTKPAPTWC